MVTSGAHKYQFGDSGSILIRVGDEDMTDHVKLGETWYVVLLTFFDRGSIYY